LTAGWRVELAARALRDLGRLDRPVRERVLDALDRLTGEPPQGDLVRLSGRDEWRLRVGDWRVRCELDPASRVVFVLRVLPRGRAYRD
jgi:mRNA interferase RelE/StbE